MKQKNSTVDERKFNDQEVYFPFFFSTQNQVHNWPKSYQRHKNQDEVFALAPKKNGNRKLATVTG